MRNILKPINWDEVRKMYFFNKKNTRLFDERPFQRKKRWFTFAATVWCKIYIVYRLAGVECGEQLNHA